VADNDIDRDQLRKIAWKALHKKGIPIQQLEDLRDTCEKVGYQGLVKAFDRKIAEENRRIATEQAKRDRFAFLIQQGLKPGSQVVYHKNTGDVEATVYDIKGEAIRIKQTHPPRYVYEVNPLRLELVG